MGNCCQQKQPSEDKGLLEGDAKESTEWRIVNDEEIEDHWNIGELRFYDHSGHDVTQFVKCVICSHNYDRHDLGVVRNGDWFTGGHANRRTWAGSDRRKGQAPGGSWLGYRFSKPVRVAAVALAQGAGGFERRNQGVARARLQRNTPAGWRAVGHLLFPSPLCISPVAWSANRIDEISGQSRVVPVGYAAPNRPEQQQPAAPVTNSGPLGCCHQIYGTEWRISNVDRVGDHWNIGELRFFNSDGEDVTPLKNAKSVICSHNYDRHDLSVVSNGDWFTGGHAHRRTWAGSDRREGQAPGGSWLGYRFSKPVRVAAVALAQGRSPDQQVQTAKLEGRNAGESWRVAGFLSLRGALNQKPVIAANPTDASFPPASTPGSGTARIEI